MAAIEGGISLGVVQVTPPGAPLPGGGSWWTTAAWMFLVIFLVVIVALIVWWILAITVPARAKDLDVCDLHARDITTSGNTCLGGNLTVAGNVTNEAATIVRALSLPPVPDQRLVIELDGTESSLLLTSDSATAPSVTLPPGTDNPGLVIAVFNQSGSTSFSVSAHGADTIEGSSGPVGQTSSAVFVSMGRIPNAAHANWKQIL